MPLPPGVDPTYVKYFKLTWVALASTQDGVDVGADPDLDTLSGTILLKPSLSQPLLFRNIDVPFTLPIMKRTIDLKTGKIDEQGRAYTMLEAAVPEAVPISWYWVATPSVSYKGIPIQINPVSFMVEPGGEIDLTDVLIAGVNTQYPDITLPPMNTFLQNFGGVKGARRLTQAEFDALPTEEDGVMYLIHNPI